MSLQTTNSVLLVPPLHFAYNKETLTDNHFVHETKLNDVDMSEKAMQEFVGLYDLLVAQGIEVLIFPSPSTSPDAIYANNWLISLYQQNAKLILMPMAHKSRQEEVFANELEQCFLDNELEVPELVDFRSYSEPGEALEGTGSLVLDRINLIAYMAISNRSNLKLAQAWTKKFGYELVSFDTKYHHQAIYHTNILLSIASEFVCVCSEAIDPNQREMVLERLGQDREIIEISLEQMQSFCANILQLEGKDGPILLVSNTAYQNFTAMQIKSLEKYTQILPTPFDFIEKVGGGGVRCSICELFL